MNKKYAFPFAFILLLSMFLLTGCKSSRPLSIRKDGFYLDTIITITLYDTEDSSLLEEGMKLCGSYENMFSTSKKGSDIYNVNHSNGQPVTVSEETRYLIEKGIEYGKRSDGLFDISIGSISQLWDFTSEDPVLPSSEEIKNQLPYVDYSQIILDGNTVTLPAGMQLDLGGIAKGYIGDKLVDFYKEKGVKSALLNLGGNILCIGSPPDKDAFHIGIKKPFSAEESITSVYITDNCVVTSGIYERCFEKDGILWHHILNPFTGYPVETDLYSVTIIGTPSMDADALSTICLMAGKEKGIELIENQTNVRAIFVTSNYEVIEAGKQE